MIGYAGQRPARIQTQPRPGHDPADTGREELGVDPQAARTRLEDMLRDLDSQAQTLAGEHAGQDAGELSHYDQHPADAATNLQDQDREEALQEVVAAQRTEVEAALRRIDEGSYGRCVDCGREIPAARLDARPEVQRCVEDQEKAEAAR